MLTDLRLCNFRPFPGLIFEPTPGANFLVGPNAQGKTSILEAVCLLLRLQSPRTNTPAECVSFGCAGLSIDGHCAGRHLHLKYEGKLKHFALDSKPQSSAADYLSVAKVVWISNSDLELVRGGSASRRRYLDFLGVQLITGYLHHLRSYERALRSRNALLRENCPRRQIAAFDAPLCTAGDFLLEARSRLVKALVLSSATSYRAISGSDEKFSMAYEPGAGIPMIEALASSIENESRLRTTVVGPHRDDLGLFLNDRPAAAFASEGQQRTCALALKLGQAHELTTGSGREPLFLIDDVFGELDPLRRNNLLTTLSPSAQKLITTTSLGWLEQGDFPHSVFHLVNGTLMNRGHAFQ